MKQTKYFSILLSIEISSFNGLKSPIRLLCLTLIAQTLHLLHLSLLHNCPHRLYTSCHILKLLLRTFSHPRLFLLLAHKVNSFQTFRCSLKHSLTLPSEAHPIENCKFPIHSPTPGSAPFFSFPFIIFKYILYFSYLLLLFLPH